MTGCPIDELGETADTLRDFLAGSGPPDDFIRNLAKHFANQLQVLKIDCADCDSARKTDEKVAEFLGLLEKIEQRINGKSRIVRRVKCTKRKVA